MNLQPETRERMFVASFLLLIGIFVQVTATPTYGSVQKDALIEVTPYQGLTYIQERSEILADPVHSSQIACQGSYNFEGFRTDNPEGKIVNIIEVSEGKCVYPGKVKKHFIELYGFKLVF